jgi:Uma2 family endonuclease
MNQRALTPLPVPILYPESDGQPMADNTKQARWMVVLFCNLSAIYRGRDDVFVAMNLFWYPVEGQPEVRTAPDVLVVFGRPKGDRGSYRQWEEGGIPLTVVFEILSPGNTVAEMDDKQLFYEEHGVEEYYVYDPDHNRLMAWLRQGNILRRVRPMQGLVSPRLGIRFDLTGPEMTVYGPDGRRFLTFEELEKIRLETEQRASQAEQRASQAEQRASQAEQRAVRLADLSRKARRGTASAEELSELDALLESPPSAAEG